MKLFSIFLLAIVTDRLDSMLFFESSDIFLSPFTPNLRLTMGFIFGSIR